MNIKTLYFKIMALPKSIYFNFKYLPIKQAIKLPVLISHRTFLDKAKGSVKINSDTIKTSMINIGFGEVGIFDRRKSRAIWRVEGNVVFNGVVNIGHGSKINVGKNGILELGNRFSISAETQIVCEKNIVFGENCLLSWDILIMDTDYHKIRDFDENILNNDKEIIIGNNVWIAAKCLILKGVKIENDTIVAAGSKIVRSIKANNVIIGGEPNRILKRNVVFER